MNTTNGNYYPAETAVNCKSSKALWQTISRAVVFWAVVLMPWLTIEDRFFATLPFALFFILEPLVRKWLDEHRKRVGIAVVLSVAMLSTSFDADAQIVNDPINDPEGDQKVMLIECAAAAAVVAITVGTYWWYYQKSKKNCPKVLTNYTARIEAENPWPDDPSPKKDFAVRTEYAGYFNDGFVLSESDCECKVFPVIEWITPASGLARPRIYFPSDDLVTEGEYLSLHGLTDARESYSVNRVPTAVRPDVFTYTNRTFTINTLLPKRTSVLERSRDLKLWTPLLTSVVPPGTYNNCTDGTREPNGDAYYRIRMDAALVLRGSLDVGSFIPQAKLDVVTQ